ncbi:MAG: hypothetical protein WCG85_14375 [Polyangia bacterium]
MFPTKPAKPAILGTGILLLSLLTVGCGGGNAQLPPASAGVAASAPVTCAAPLADFLVDVSQLHGGLARLAPPAWPLRPPSARPPGDSLAEIAQYVFGKTALDGVLTGQVPDKTGRGR